MTDVGQADGVGIGHQLMKVFVHVPAGYRVGAPVDQLDRDARMALSNYLLQRIIAVWLFWGFGPGWYGKYGAGTVEIIAIIIFAAQAAFSITWLRYFRYGPVEWL